MTTELQSFKEKIEALDREASKDWRRDDNAWPPERTICDRECIVFTTVTNPHSRDPEGHKKQQEADLEFTIFARTALPALLRIAEDRSEVAEKYATAARVITLHLKQFCDEKLPYDEMIADASRKAAASIEQYAARLKVAEAALERYADPASWRINAICDPNSENFAGTEIATAALAEIRG